MDIAGTWSPVLLEAVAALGAGAVLLADLATPEARKARTTSHIAWRSSTSTPAVGSSRNRIWGSCESALAIMTRRFMPPDKVMILASRLSHKDKSFRTLATRSGSARLPNRPRLNVTVAQTVSKASVVSSCGTRPISERAAR
jgi:hypothetical protein